MKLALNKNDVKGRVGGFARAKKLSAARRKEIAVNAANKRWKTKKKVVKWLKQ